MDLLRWTWPCRRGSCNGSCLCVLLTSGSRRLRNYKTNFNNSTTRKSVPVSDCLWYLLRSALPISSPHQLYITVGALCACVCLFVFFFLSLSLNSFHFLIAFAWLGNLKWSLMHEKQKQHTEEKKKTANKRMNKNSKVYCATQHCLITITKGKLKKKKKKKNGSQWKCFGFDNKLALY